MVNINPQWPTLGFISRLIRICSLSESSDSRRTMKLYVGRALYVTQEAQLTWQSTGVTFNNAPQLIYYIAFLCAFLTFK